VIAKEIGRVQQVALASTVGTGRPWRRAVRARMPSALHMCVIAGMIPFRYLHGMPLACLPTAVSLCVEHACVQLFVCSGAQLCVLLSNLSFAPTWEDNTFISSIYWYQYNASWYYATIHNRMHVPRQRKQGQVNKYKHIMNIKLLQGIDGRLTAPSPTAV
jgi:hypothetical protein